MSHNQIWSEALSHLKAQLPGHALSAWFEPVEPIGLSDNKILLEVPNQFFAEWIESHYEKELESSLNSIGGMDYGFKFVINSNPSQISSDSTTTPQQRPKVLQQNNINKLYRFDNFIEGGNNEFAKNAALSVANNPGENGFNPLIIYGGVGLGKTHIMHAIGNRAVELNNHLNVVIVTSEKFTLDFVNGLRKNKTIEFAQKYRRADVLLIDDIQFFRGKEQTQEQFFHTFNALYQAGKQIVMTADKYPGEMKGLQDRLLSRFESGLSVDVQPPNFEVRVAILLEKAEQNGLTLDYDIIEFIARHVKNNVRDLEGTIIRILAKSSLMNKEIDHSLVREVVQERTGGRLNNDISMEDIIQKVSNISSISEDEIVGKSRKSEISDARQVSMYLSREIIGTSLNNIGLFFGGRDHTTVIHAVNTITNKIESDTRIKNMLSMAKQELGYSF
jgi:chromosomal replication initiator protein